ncbi:helix-turn-helix domain-containing protein [Flavobacterium sp.]|jgi:hypothetical protein|uniref:helix-turn-helix domain-containing protein n=1 Tax=Flavobacterium sp. TaxID=239 RepID=UPI0022C86A10|nr:helix-turn-helix domain-containing protein [Flavobacterium sp.]MCZ8143780.1 helix-turn-helix domain-containing protein [Flavobacterium sp.]MCZ8367427.1 helix-turn-helix domain-containing protein [Flavobacterium sp.]
MKTVVSLTRGCRFMLAVLWVSASLAQSPSQPIKQNKQKVITLYQNARFTEALNVLQPTSTTPTPSLDEVVLTILCQYHTGNAEAAAITVLQNMERLTQKGTPLQQAQGYLVLGINELMAQRYSTARLRLEAALRQFKALKNTEAMRLAHYFLAKCWEAQGQDQAALPHYTALTLPTAHHPKTLPIYREAFEVRLQNTPKDHPEYATRVAELYAADTYLTKHFPKAQSLPARYFSPETVSQYYAQTTQSHWGLWTGIVIGGLSLGGYAFYRKSQRKKNTPQENNTPPLTPEEAPIATAPTSQHLTADYWDSADMLMHFKIGEKTLYRWRKKGYLPFINIGGKIYYPKQAVQELLQQQLDDKYHPIHQRR